jgi:hypothetical protein
VQAGELRDRMIAMLQNSSERATEAEEHDAAADQG